jgi:hypothetical protein
LRTVPCRKPPGPKSNRETGAGPGHGHGVRSFRVYMRAAP